MYLELLAGSYTYFDSFLPYTYKFGMINTLLYRWNGSDWTKFHLELVS